jgi:hypothetical protein
VLVVTVTVRDDGESADGEHAHQEGLQGRNFESQHRI